MMFTNRETEYTQGGKCGHPSYSGHVLSFLKETAHATESQWAALWVQVKHPVPSGCVGDSTLNEGPLLAQDEWYGCMCYTVSLLGTKKPDSLLNSRAGKAPQGLRQKHLSNQCQKQQDSLCDRARPSLELTFLLRQKGHLQRQALGRRGESSHQWLQEQDVLAVYKGTEANSRLWVT